MRGIRVPVALIEWFDLRRSVTVIVVVLGGYTAYLYRLHRLVGADHPDVVVSAAVTAAPLVALVLAPALIGLAFGYVRWVRERVWTPWQGIYHAFDDHQIRVVEARDRLWFSSDDVHAALGAKPRPAVLRALTTSRYRRDDGLGDVLSNDGLAALFGRSTDRLALRLIRWADGDVRRPWQKRRDAEQPRTRTST
jgi:hypothetical protein